ncbi:MAG: hypothetical protein AAB512_04060 [Patescibacteria group bacterium]
MVAKSLAKLIDEAIIPAVILIIAKMAGLLVSAYFFNFKYEVVFGGAFNVLPKVVFANLPNYVIAENYSNLAMFLTAAAGTLIVLMRAHFLHETHVTPQTQQKLASLNLENLILSSFHLYHIATIWLIFLWLSTGFLIASTISGVTYPQITVIALIVAANFTWIFAMDVQKEMEITRWN